jgi:glycosyltransferase involved in cell wall biosynthesis
MKFISVVSGCYNEEDNVRELHERVCRVFANELPEYTFEFIIIDNASQDGTVKVLKEIAGQDKRVKVIVNNRNFGHVRSPYHAVLQASGEAIVGMASDLEDPPEMIPQFVRKWEEGYKIVLAQKTSSEEFFGFFLVRKFYYYLVNRLSDVPLVKNVTGFGLYDRRVIEDIRKIGDPYPYFRGLICDLGYEQFLIPFRKPVRKRGFSKNNFYTLYDLAILGITNHSKVPLRLSVFAGVGIGILSFLVAFAYLVYKLLFWNNFSVGTAPVVIGIFFLGAVELFCVGMLGEYIGSIHTQVLKRPPVIEKERINFD